MATGIPSVGGIQATVEITADRVVKHYRAEASDFGFADEVRGLRTLAEVVRTVPATAGWRLVAPGLLDVDPVSRSIKMSRLEGEPFGDTTALSPIEDLEVCEVIAEALRAFWQIAEVPYGDLHLANVLVDPVERTVGMIDPGCAREVWHCRHLSADDWPASRDRGYLAFIAAVSDTRPGRWPGRRRRASLAWHVVRRLGDGDMAHEAEAAACARFHIDRLREFEGRRLRRRIVAAIARARVRASAPAGW